MGGYLWVIYGSLEAHYWTFWFQTYKVSKNLRYVHKFIDIKAVRLKECV
jgi:hypothetical protein